MNRKTQKTDQVGSILERIENNRNVHLHVPGVGRLHVDRKLPFIILYRFNGDYRDYGAARLIKSESSYLLYEGEEGGKDLLRRLIGSLVGLLAPEFGAYLILVVRFNDNYTLDDSEMLGPEVTIIQPEKRPVEFFSATLEREMGKYVVDRVKTEVRVKPVKGELLPEITKIGGKKALQDLNCFTAAVELNPFFINPENTMPYPLVFRRFHRHFSRSLRRALFEFTRNKTRKRPTNYQSLGNRSFVKNVRDIDRKIAEITGLFDLLFLVTPHNVDDAWQVFRRSGYSDGPRFRYRPVPVEPSRLKQQLFKIDLDSIGDPVLFQLFYEKQLELDRQISLLQDRGTRRFLYGSLQLYGGVSDDLCAVAETILDNYPEPVHGIAKESYYSAKEIAARATREIEKYRKLYPEITAKVVIADDVSGVLVSRGDIYIGAKTRIRKTRLKSVLNHEVGIHVVTYFNGLSQPFQLLKSGFAGYDELQEGIAILSEYISGGLNENRLRLLAARVKSAEMMVDGADFVEVFRRLHREYGFTRNLSFIIAMRIFRSGGFTKDIVYLKGFIKLLKYLHENNNWKHLFYGKVSFEQLPLILELESRRILNKIPVIPGFMSGFMENRGGESGSHYERLFTMLE